MEIEAHLVERENPFAAARNAFEKLVQELSVVQTQKKTHSELEKLINVRGIEVMRLLLQGHLEARGAEVSLMPVRNKEGSVLSYQRERGRALESLFGTVWVNRIGYEAKGERMLYPLDGDLNLPRERYSLGVRQRVATEAVKNSFDEAVAAVSTTTGAHVPKRQAEELVSRAAIDFDGFYDQDSVVLEPEESGELLVLSVDGKGVVMRSSDLRQPTQKAAQKRKQKLSSKLSQGEKKGAKRMATVAAVYTVERFERTPEQVYANIMQRLRLVERKRPRPEQKRVWASLQKAPKEVIGEVFDEALGRDPNQQKQWIALVDGNKTQLDLLKQYAQKHSLQLTIILDLMHVLSYLWKAAHAFFPSGSKESEEWVAERFLKLLSGQASSVAGGIRRSATLRGLSDSQRQPVDKCANYLLKYKAFLHYDEYLAQGFPICSGVIEGTCRHLINDRLDRTGARWSLKGAEAVLKLRSLYASGDLEDYWTFHERQEQQRNHNSRYADQTLPQLQTPKDRATGSRHLHLVK